MDPPSGFAEALEDQREGTVSTVEGRALRSVKEKFDAIVAWQESRVGSGALLDLLARRLEPSGQLWVVTAMKKVRGPETPSIHRLQLADLVKAFAPHGLRQDRETRLSAWHVAYRFVPASHSTYGKNLPAIRKKRPSGSRVSWHRTTSSVEENDTPGAERLMG